MGRTNKNNYGLLPYIREDIYGLTPDLAQIYGWEIKSFDIQNQWKFSRGEGVKIAVIDTGCDLDHSDLKNNIIQGKNFVDSTKDPYDVVGHGTHTAGTIAAEDNGSGIVGIAPKAQIMPVKALGEESIALEFYTCIPFGLIGKVNHKRVLSSVTNSSKA